MFRGIVTIIFNFLNSGLNVFGYGPREQYYPLGLYILLLFYEATCSTKEVQVVEFEPWSMEMGFS